MGHAADTHRRRLLLPASQPANQPAHRHASRPRGHCAPQQETTGDNSHNNSLNKKRPRVETVDPLCSHLPVPTPPPQPVAEASERPEMPACRCLSASMADHHQPLFYPVGLPARILSLTLISSSYSISSSNYSSYSSLFLLFLFVPVLVLSLSLSLS